MFRRRYAAGRGGRRALLIAARGSDTAREIFSNEHELYREPFQRLAEAEIVPRVEKWNTAVQSIYAGSNQITKLLTARRLGLE